MPILRLYMTVMAAACFFVHEAKGQESASVLRPRIIVTADPELDDNNSLIRFLLYSDGLDIEGLVYASSGYHWRGDGKGTKWFVPGREYTRFGLDTCPCVSWRWAKNERFIHRAVEAYETVFPNLKRHSAGYPTPAYLKSKIRYGNIDFDGDISKDSPGSDLIKSLILDNKPGRLFITAWGGQSTIARALSAIQEQYRYSPDWESVKKKIVAKLVLLPSGDQDDTYASYIKPNWPGIEYREFSGGPNYGYGAQLGAKPEDSVYLTASWMKENVSDRGPLGRLYRVWGDGKQMVKGDRMDYFGLADYSSEELKKMGYVVWMPVQTKGSWLGEGDDFTFMNMLNNGLRAYENSSYGGWGGRQIGVPVKQAAASSYPIAADTSAAAMSAMLAAANGREMRSPEPDFFPQAQRDFAARLKWSVTNTYGQANHAPAVKIEGPLQILAAAGQKLRVNATVSDPDGNTVSLKWWLFETGTQAKKAIITHTDNAKTELIIPDDAVSGETIHVIAEATDNGTPVLTSYQRVIITVKNK